MGKLGSRKTGKNLIVPTLPRGNASGDAPASLTGMKRKPKAGIVPAPERGNDLNSL